MKDVEKAQNVRSGCAGLKCDFFFVDIIEISTNILRTLKKNLKQCVFSLMICRQTECQIYQGVRLQNKQE